MGTDVTLTEDDEDKNVVDADGNPVGRVMRVEHGKAYVDADQGPTDTIRAKLGWDDGDEETYPLDTSMIKTVTDDEIHLKK